MTETTTENADFSLSDSAAARVSELLGQEAPGTKLRIAIEGGGCSGFQYKFDFDTEDKEDDQVFKTGNARVVIDRTSLEFLGGSQLDYIERLGAAHFEIKNPNATANCGCGNSFSVM